MTIKLITDKLLIYFISNKTLINQKTATFFAPEGKFTTVCFYENIDTLGEIPQLVKDAIKKDIGVVMVCSKLPLNPIVDPHILYAISGWRWLTSTLFCNPLKFKAVLYHPKMALVAKQFANLTDFKIPIIKNIQELDTIAVESKKATGSILMEIIGGMGDHIMCIPIIKTHHKQNKKISLLVKPEKVDIFKNLSYITKVYTDKSEVDVTQFDIIFNIDFGKILTNYSKAVSKQNRIYAIASLCGLNVNNLVTDVPEIVLTDKEKEWAKKRVQADKKLFLGWDCDRSYSRMPEDYALSLVEKLKAEGYTVYSSTKRDKKLTGCVNFTGLSLRQLFALINEMDVVVTLDTAYLHIAAALNKKTILLPTTINPMWRASTYKNCEWVEPTISCYPCNAQQKHSIEEMPCIKTRRPECIYSIKQERIIEKLRPKKVIAKSNRKAILVKMPNGELGDKLVVLGLMSELRREYKGYRLDVYLQSERYSNAGGYAQLFIDCVDNYYINQRDINPSIYGKIMEVSAYGIHNAEIDCTLKKYVQLSRYQRWAKQLGFNFMGEVDAIYKVKEKDWQSHRTDIPDITKLKAPIVGIAPLTSNLTKNWGHILNNQFYKWQQVINYLSDKGCSVVTLHHTPLDYKNCFNLGNVSPRELGYAISKMDFMIGCEAGVTHFAGVLKIPLIVLVGSSSPLVLRHYTNVRIMHYGNCYSCNRFISPNFKDCQCGSLAQNPDSKCLVFLSVEDVINEIKDFKGKEFKEKYKIIL